MKLKASQKRSNLNEKQVPEWTVRTMYSEWGTEFWVQRTSFSGVRLIVWLGNPGKEYAHTRHNVGFLFVDYLREKYGFEDWKDSKFKGIISEGMVKWEKIILLKPMTFMNLSGESVGALVNFYKIQKEDILVLSDDIDMDFGKIRLRDKGSSGGQNGLKSIAAHLGTEEFPRLKIGIGRDDRYSVADWVLSKFSGEELKRLEKDVFAEGVEKVEEWLEW